MKQKMNRRLDKWRAAYYSSDEFDTDPEDYLARDVLAEDNHLINTGLLNEKGEPILRPRRQPVGFIKF